MSTTLTQRASDFLPPTGSRTWWILYLFGPLGAISAGLLVFPDLVFDRYIWQYLWGPVVADATSGTATHEGIIATTGYNLVNTITYLALILYSLPGLNAFLDTADIELDARLAYGLAPLIVAGGAMRALEDASVLTEPLDLLFITPSIYVVVAGITVVTLATGVVLRDREIISVPFTAGIVGTVWAGVAIGWAIVYGITSADTVRLVVPVLTTTIALSVTGVFYLVGSLIDWQPLHQPIYLLLIFGQMWDASQNLVGVSLYEYAPKLFITNAVYQWTGFAGSTFLLKLLATAAFVWLLVDEEDEMDPRWWWLLAFVGIAVGLPMGIRGSLRMMVGV